MYLLAHVPLGTLVYQFPALAAVHGMVALSIGMWSALQRKTTEALAACVYIGVAEVLWRMADSPLPYEFAKYAIILIAAVALTRGRVRPQSVWMPMLYVLGLLPSTVALLADARISGSRISELLRFYVAGPLALGLATWLCISVSVTRAEMVRILRAATAPALSVVAVMAYSTLSAERIVFNTESNSVTTGGFGPNQVSAILGLATLAVTLVLLSGKSRRHFAAGGVVLLLVISGATVMTFSRGGLWAAAGAMLCAMPFLLRDRSVARRLVTGGVVSVIAATALVWPKLNAFTQGNLANRFSSTDPTSRDALVRDDLEIFLRHPVLGVGPGRSEVHRTLVHHGIGHTEYSRMLAEHGAGGAVAVVALMLMAWQIFMRPLPPVDKGLRIALLCWSMLSMAHVAMRIGLISLAFGLAHLRCREEMRDAGVS